MRQWWVIFNKEMLEMSRNYKWIWFPISFILLGISEPLSTYYMPKIIDAFGGLPEGTVIEIPVPDAPEVLFQSISQYNTLGVLIIVLATMGMISGELKSGVAELILVKPVSYFSYITAKWAGALVLIWTSYFLGYLASWYYVFILFDSIAVKNLVSSFVLYGVWLTMVLTISVFFNSLMKTPGVVGFSSMAVIILLSIVSSSLSHLLEWSPTQISAYTRTLLSTGNLPEDAWGAIVIAIGAIVCMLGVSVYIFRKKELA